MQRACWFLRPTRLRCARGKRSLFILSSRVCVHCHPRQCKRRASTQTDNGRHVKQDQPFSHIHSVLRQPCLGRASCVNDRERGEPGHVQLASFHLPLPITLSLFPALFTRHTLFPLPTSSLFEGEKKRKRAGKKFRARQREDRKKKREAE
jgi:hypothetical protein